MITYDYMYNIHCIYMISHDIYHVITCVHHIMNVVTSVKLSSPKISMKSDIFIGNDYSLKQMYSPVASIHRKFIKYFPSRHNLLLVLRHVRSTNIFMKFSQILQKKLGGYPG